MTVNRIVADFSCRSIESTRAFYVDVFDLEVAMDAGWVITLRDRDNPSAQLSLVSHDATAPVDPDASIEVADVDAAHDAAVRRGAEVVHPLTDEPWGVRRFFVRDPDGRVINVLAHL